MLENLETPVEQDTEYFNIKTNYSGELVEEYADGIRVFDPEAPAQLRPKLISANVKIQSMTQELITWKERYSTERSRYFEKKNQVEDFLKENHEDLGRELTQELAEMFDIELTKDVEFTAKLEISGRVTVPLWTRDEDVFDDVDFEVDTSYNVDGTVDSVDITSIEED